MQYSTQSPKRHPAWNKGKLLGQKPPLKLKEVWAIRTRLQLAHKTRDLAMFNLAIDSKLRSCDLVKLQVRDVTRGTQILKRAMILQQKTHQPVQFELTAQTREALSTWIQQANLSSEDHLFKSRRKRAEHISTRQYARIASGWVASIGLDPAEYGTHSIRRTRNLRAVQLLLGHRKLETTVRYLGIEVDDAREIAEQTDI